jgi:4a-hydroxytetrahydrobiopterin dehydratase
MSSLANNQCSPDTELLQTYATNNYLQQISPDWELAADGRSISRTFRFKDYYQTIAFVNVVAMVAHQQDHHPDITATYNTCRVEFSTHSVGGLSLNDFICAAKVDRILSI